MRQPLPIDALLPEIVAAFKDGNCFVLEAPPGAGKTTRVPVVLHEAGFSAHGEILILQPRRLAARLAAARIAAELGEPLGRTAGYQVRFEEVASAQTRIRLLTEGLLTRQLLADPQLRGIAVVLLDEFHERHLSGDLALALLRRLQLTARPDLKLAVMSATLEPAPLAAFLGNCPVLRSSGRLFPVSIEFLDQPDTRPLEIQVAAALKRLGPAPAGDTLVFLPGAAEIRRAQAACQEFAEFAGLDVHVLHGELSNAAQDLAVRPGPRPKVILSTNVAETSVTIEGVAAVVDSGLHRRAGHSPWTGLPSLSLEKISRAAALQRTGRAGRLRAGRGLRLYTEADFQSRPLLETPEIRRLDLAELLLSLHFLGIRNPAELDFFEAPPSAALAAAEKLLRRLGALEGSGALTPVGRRMARLPCHPRLARLVCAAEAHGLGTEGAALAALLSERDIRADTGREQSGSGRPAAGHSADSDPLELLELFEQAEKRAVSGRSAQGLDQAALQAVRRSAMQLSRLTESRSPPLSPPAAPARDAILMQAILAAFPDRVAKRRKPGSDELLLSGSGAVRLDASSAVREAPWLVVVDAAERGGRQGGVIATRASRIEPEWLLDCNPDELGESDELVWNEKTERVERVTRLAYGSLTIEESRSPAPPSPAATAILAAAAATAGPGRFLGSDDWQTLRARLALVRRHCPEIGLPELDDEREKDWLRAACDGAVSFEGIAPRLTPATLLESLGPAARQIQKLAPEKITLPGGRSVPVHYEPDRPPWIESRLQDFFGMKEGPAICNGRVSLVLHLLAPNQRALQVTTDLAGFWSRHYPKLRQEYSRNYPKHSWPEDPAHASPPAPGARRR